MILSNRALFWVASAVALVLPLHSEAADGTKSAEALITDYYQSILGRDPDAGGLAYWRDEGQLIQTLGGDITETWRALAITFFQSPEYRASNPADAVYLEDLYDAFFKRAPDAGGAAYWQNQMNAGMPREAVLLWFLFSPEFGTYMTSLFGDNQARAESRMVVDFYRGFLNRLPDEGGFAYWLGRFRTAQCAGREAVLGEVDAITQQFLASSEYSGRARTAGGEVTDLYNAFLRRGPELQGFYYWEGRLDGGDHEQIRREFMASAEFQSRIDQVLAAGCPTLAAASALTPAIANQSVSPFLAVVELRGLHADRISSVAFTVQPKAGAVSRPVQASYSAQYLAGAGYGPTASYGYRVPVFGLYSAYNNQLNMQATFTDGSAATVDVAVPSAAWQDPTGVYANVNILKPRAPGSALGFDYFYIRSMLGLPVVMDTDGEVRWWIPAQISAGSSLFERNAFSVGIAGMSMRRVELDGTWSDTKIMANYGNIHHNVDPGRTGILVEVDGTVGGVSDLENNLIEIAPDGSLINEWKFGNLIAAYMASRGDDPTQFITLGRDWFHMNAAAYDPHDDTIIASSRENFLIKIRYTTGEILWMLGDPTKYWYSFPSLRDKAIALEAPGLYPIGQHAVSVLPNGDVMVFNDGAPSLNNPAGTSAGERRGYSAVSVYSINPITRTARESRSFDYAQSVLSQFCSSAYAAGESILVSYAQATSGSRARLVGLGADNGVVFDFEMVNSGFCGTSWNAAPIPFDAMTF